MTVHFPCPVRLPEVSERSKGLSHRNPRCPSLRGAGVGGGGGDGAVPLLMVIVPFCLHLEPVQDEAYLHSQNPSPQSLRQTILEIHSERRVCTIKPCVTRTEGLCLLTDIKTRLLFQDPVIRRSPKCHS